ncbi:MAG: sulfatase-like hydrolase/transferase, partial [Opitutales bacterium]|nr:sulfatase-like hydrolase/transferase [Opitutales bacterium]
MRFLIFTALFCVGSLVSLTAKDKPNVIVIYSDDQGSVDANCYGSKDLATPTLDKLAATGVRFTQMYSPSAICSASRAGLLTGRFPPRAGVPGNVSSHKGKAGLPTEEVTMAEIFKHAGYATAHVGKWHLGYTPETMPNGQGFDFSYGHMGGCIDNYSHFFYWVPPNLHDLWRNGVEIWEDGRYFGDLMVRECTTFMDNNSKRPFFMYWAINWPHYPLQGTDKWREHYKDHPHPRDKYGAFISSMDEIVGKVVSHVEKMGLRENTIIVFQSDHGHSIETRTFGGGGSSGPYRGAKGSLFEGGIRVPSIVSWPGKIPEGEVRSQMATGCDWFPTLAELSGAKLPKGHKLDGKSLVEVISDGATPSPHKSFYWQLGKQSVVREGNWKLLHSPNDNNRPEGREPSGKVFLANLTEDPGESKNLAKKHPDVVNRLTELKQSYVAGL